MSLKPPKKSDLKKPWMNKPDRAIKIRPEYHLIVTEGTGTEPAYFGAIQEIINNDYPEKIQLKVFGVGDNTINLFEKAKRLAKDNPNGYRHVWIVYDTDDFPAEHIDRVVQLCAENSTEEIEYHAIWSNQCIELWFLLHFQENYISLRGCQPSVMFFFRPKPLATVMPPPIKRNAKR